MLVAQHRRKNTYYTQDRVTTENICDGSMLTLTNYENMSFGSNSSLIAVGFFSRLITKLYQHIAVYKQSNEQTQQNFFLIKLHYV